MNPPVTILGFVIVWLGGSCVIGLALAIGAAVLERRHLHD